LLRKIADYAPTREADFAGKGARGDVVSPTDDNMSSPGAGSTLRRSEHALERSHAHAENPRGGVLVALGLGQHLVDVLLLDLVERRPARCARSQRADEIGADVGPGDGWPLGEGGRTL